MATMNRQLILLAALLAGCAWMVSGAAVSGQDGTPFTSISGVSNNIQNNGVKKSCFLTSMQRLLELVVRGEACSLEFVTEARRFTVDHLVESSEGYGSLYERGFFVALMNEVSEACQRRLADQLEAALASAEINKPETSKLLASLSGYGEVSNYASLEMQNGVLKVLSDSHMPLLLVADLEPVKGLVKLCNTKLWPIAEQLVVPLVELAQLDFNYRGPRAADTRARLSRGPGKVAAKLLNGITAKCSLLKRAEICQEPKLKGNNYKLEFHELMGIKLEASARKCLDTRAWAGSAAKDAYVAPGVHLDDQLWLKGAELDELVSRSGTFDPSGAGELDRYKHRMTDSIKQRVKGLLRFS